MKCPDVEMASISDLIELLKRQLEGYRGPIWYRGQSFSEWKLEPKLLRDEIAQSESYLLNKFKQNASYILDKTPRSDFEWLFLMQHYGMPTRLLDWTESPLVALYFSVQSNPDKNGSLWVLLPTELNKKSNYRPDFEFEIPAFDDVHLSNYLPETIASEHKSKLFPMAAIAVRNSARMQAQLGVFTISHRENIYIETVGDETVKTHIWRLIIPSNAKRNIYNELLLLGYSRFQLFPELESLRNIIY